LIHNRWTLVDHSAADLLQQAEGLGVAVVNAAIYGGGILADPQGGSTRYGYRPATEETLHAITEMDRICRDAGTDLPTAALQASVNDPRFSSTIVGMSRPSRLTAIVERLSTDLPPGLLDQLAELLPAQRNWLDFQS
jgi:D-threo-aldose 1-dehydrogenase